MKNKLNKYLRLIRVKFNKYKLKNKDFTIISSNCIGGIISNELNQKFMSPTINLFFYPNDFIKFINDIEFYLSEELKVKIQDKFNYPIGILRDIEIHFMHYESFELAKAKWEERAKRVNYNNLFVIMTDRDNCTEKTIKAFDEVPIKNKVIFTNKEYKQFSSTFYIKGFEKENSVGHLFEYCGINGKKYYDQFDYINWFNKGINKN